MDASNRPRKQPAARRSSRRPDCQRDPAPPGSETQAGGLTVTIKVLPLEGDGAETIAERQLAVIVRLLRRAAEAKNNAASAGE
jgi:hypothetical protein